MSLKDTIRIKSQGHALTDTLEYGQYKGYTIKAVIDTNPGYIQWRMDNRRFLLDDEAYQYMEDYFNDLPF